MRTFKLADTVNKSDFPQYWRRHSLLLACQKDSKNLRALNNQKADCKHIRTGSAKAPLEFVVEEEEIPEIVESGLSILI